MPLSENTARDFDMYKTNKMIEPRTRPDSGGTPFRVELLTIEI